MKTSFAALAALAMFSDSADARVSFGKCPQITNIENFAPASYSGKWYEQVRDMMNPYTISTDCVTKEFSKFNAEEKRMDLYFRGYYWLKLGYMGVNGTLYQCDEGSPDSFTCMATMGGGTHRLPFSIWRTDYESFDLQYSCSEKFGLKYESFSVATREP